MPTPLSRPHRPISSRGGGGGLLLQEPEVGPGTVPPVAMFGAPRGPAANGSAGIPHEHGHCEAGQPLVNSCHVERLISLALVPQRERRAGKPALLPFQPRMASATST